MTSIDRITMLYAALHPTAASPASVYVEWQRPVDGPHGYVARVSAAFWGTLPMDTHHESAVFTTAGAALNALADDLAAKVRARKQELAAAVRKAR